MSTPPNPRAQNTLRRVICSAGAIGLLLTPLAAGANNDLFCSVDGPVFADDKIYVKKHSSIRGFNGELTHVLSNGKLKMHDDSVIDGHVTAKDIKLKDGALITGDIVEAEAGIEPEDIHDLVETFRHNNDNHLIPLTAMGEHPLKDLKLEVDKGDRLVLPAGDYFLEKVKIKKGAVIELAGAVRIYMEKGKIDLKYGSLVGAEAADLSIMISKKGHVKAGGHSGFHAALYAPKSKFDLKGEGTASGSLVVDKMKIDKGAEFLAADACVEGPPGLESYPKPPPVFDFWEDDEDPFEDIRHLWGE